MNLTGSCLCGKVTYEVTGEPLETEVCHCSDCQKSCGSAFTAGYIVSNDQLKISGELSMYTKQGESGLDSHQYFCPICGSPMKIEIEVMPGATILTFGSLDQKDWFEPKLEVFACGARKWANVTSIEKSYLRNPDD